MRRKQEQQLLKRQQEAEDAELKRLNKIAETKRLEELRHQNAITETKKTAEEISRFINTAPSHLKLKTQCTKCNKLMYIDCNLINKNTTIEFESINEISVFLNRQLIASISLNYKSIYKDKTPVFYLGSDNGLLYLSRSDYSSQEAHICTECQKKANDLEVKRIAEQLHIKQVRDSRKFNIGDKVKCTYLHQDDRRVLIISDFQCKLDGWSGESNHGYLTKPNILAFGKLIDEMYFECISVEST